MRVYRKIPLYIYTPDNKVVDSEAFGDYVNGTHEVRDVYYVHTYYSIYRKKCTCTHMYKGNRAAKPHVRSTA